MVSGKKKDRKKSQSPVFCVFCKRPIYKDRKTIRYYRAKSMRNPEQKQEKGWSCSSCFNGDYDDFKRPRTMKHKAALDPKQLKLPF